jgi:hypothetical protein
MLQQPRAGFAAEEHPDLALSRGETVGTARMGRKEMREALGERSAGAIRVAAIEPPQSQFEADLLSRRRQIRRPPGVVAMHGVAAMAAIWATATGKLSVCCDTQMSRIKRRHLPDTAPRERIEFIHLPLRWWPLPPLQSLVRLDLIPPKVILVANSARLLR